jgi:hypothetical protein
MSIKGEPTRFDLEINVLIALKCFEGFVRVEKKHIIKKLKINNGLTSKVPNLN